MNQYNILYKKNKYLRGLTPNDLTVEILRYKNKGEVLEFGCGEGQDAVFLSKKGFNVLGVDSSIEALENLAKLSASNNVQIKTKLENFEEYKFDKKYDVILGEASIHFLSVDKRKTIIKKIKKNTKKDGINVFGVFDSRTSKKEKASLKKWGIFFFSKNELLAYYKNWKILFYKQILEIRDCGETRGVTQIIAQNK